RTHPRLPSWSRPSPAPGAMFASSWLAWPMRWPSTPTPSCSPTSSTRCDRIMPSHRSLRMAEAIREVVSSAILFKLADPRIHAVTVLGVEVSGDLRSASIAVSVMGTPAEQEQALKGLKHATGYLQSLVAERLQTRFTPILTFKRDDSVK